MARAATIIKRGGYIGVALDVASTSLEIKEACLAGDERQCRKARYVEGGKLIGSLLGGSAIGAPSVGISQSVCKVVIGVLTRGKGLNICVAVGVGAITWGGSEIGGAEGEQMGEVVYETTYE